MLTITVYFHDRKWRIKRSDREVATTTNKTFIFIVIQAIFMAFLLQSRFILMSKDDIGVGKIDFFRVDIADVPIEEVSSEEIEAELDKLANGTGDKNDE